MCVVAARILWHAIEISVILCNACVQFAIVAVVVVVVYVLWFGNKLVTFQFYRRAPLTNPSKLPVNLF